MGLFCYVLSIRSTQSYLTSFPALCVMVQVKLSRHLYLKGNLSLFISETSLRVGRCDAGRVDRAREAPIATPSGRTRVLAPALACAAEGKLGGRTEIFPWSACQTRPGRRSDCLLRRGAPEDRSYTESGERRSGPYRASWVRTRSHSAIAGAIWPLSQLRLARPARLGGRWRPRPSAAPHAGMNALRRGQRSV